MSNQIKRPKEIPAGPKVHYEKEGNPPTFFLVVMFIILLFAIATLVGDCGRDNNSYNRLKEVGCQKAEYYDDLPGNWSYAGNEYYCPPDVDWYKIKYGRPNNAH